jgi:hypothetical protein
MKQVSGAAGDLVHDFTPASQPKRQKKQTPGGTVPVNHGALGRKGARQAKVTPPDRAVMLIE